MENAGYFKDKIRGGELCIGTNITFTDPTATEALCRMLDYVWIDMEHNALSLESVQGHIMATKGSRTTPLVRVPWNDPVMIKRVLDIGAAGVIVPMIRTAADARLAVAACRYPPDGIRGYGPRRGSNYGDLEGPDFCRTANETIIVIVQIEHTEAVDNLDEILAVPGLTSICVGPMDLAGSMGHSGNPRHSDVLSTIKTVIEKTRQTDVFAGIAFGDDLDLLAKWVEQGAHWVSIASDFGFMRRAADESCRALLDSLKASDG